MAGRSLTQVAHGLLSRSFLSMIEHDQRRPSAEILLGIARRLDLMLTDLLRGVDASSYLRGLLRYAKLLNLHEHFGDASEVLTAVLSQAELGGPIWAEASVRLGYALTMAAEYELAARRLRDGLNGADALGDAELRVVARNYMGTFLRMRDHLDEAKETLNEAWQLGRGIRFQDRSVPGAILLNLGQVEWRQKRPLAALPYYRDALEIFRRVHDHLREGIALRLMGVSYAVAGVHEQAISHLRASAEVFARAGHLARQGHALGSLGIVMKEQGDLVSARKYLLQSLRLGEQLADNQSLGHTLPELAQVALLEERWDEAMRYATRAVSIAMKIESVEKGAQAEFVKAVVLAHQGHSSKAVASFQWVIDVFEARGMHKELAEACSHLGRLHMRMGEMELASAALARALDLRSSGAA